MIFALAPMLASAQTFDLNHYQNLECAGEIPKIIIKNLEKRIAEEEKKEITQKDNWREKKAKEKFIVESSYDISELLLSGLVIFNDTLSNYVHGVAKELLKNDVETFNKLHFFVVKSPLVNAFSTNEGIVLINIGLLAQLETEAQLAFILAHEITHFKKKHVLTLFTEGKKQASYNSHAPQDALLDNISFSKEFENQADEGAVEIIQQSNYSLGAIGGVFDILQLSNLPIHEIPFDITFFNSAHLVIPPSYFLQYINSIQIHDDASSTHPSITERRNKTMALISFVDNSGKKDFIQLQSHFEMIRDVARFEIISIFLANRKYESAIYSASVLLKKYPNSEFLLAAVGTSLYFLSKYANIGIQSDITSPYANIEGESQQVYYLFSSLGKQDLNVITCDYLWRIYFKFPQRADLKKKANEMLNELIRLHYPSGTAFSEEEKIIDHTSVALPTSNHEQITNGKTKVGIGEIQPKDKINVQFAFVDMFKQYEFKDAYYSALRNKDVNVTISKSYYNRGQVNYNPKEIQHVNLQKIVMVDPAYYKISNLFESNKFDPIASEKARKKYSAMIKIVGKAAQLDVVLLDSKFLNTKQVGIFNEITRLNAFIDEMYVHRNLDSMLASDYLLTQMLLQKHNSKYLAWNTIFAVTEADAMADPYTFATYSYYMPPLIPIFLIDALTPDYFTYSNVLVADIEKGKIIYDNSYKMFGKDYDDRLKSNLYYNFMQLKGKTKKKKN